MDARKIKENIRQREICDYVYEFIRDTIEEENFGDTRRFAQLIVDKIRHKHIDQPGVGEVMSVDEAKEFEQQLMPFGEFAGTKIGQVALDRLRWYADQRFIDDLRRYLRSRIVQIEIEIEERYELNRQKQSAEENDDGRL